ncbi:MAG: hypothetical protein RI967_627 [Planctomycetota bacterium]
MPRRRSILPLVVAFAAAILSGGGTARFAHLFLVHGGAACAGACAHEEGTGSAPATTPIALCASHAGHAHGEHAPAAPGTPTPAAPDDCPVCDELAVNAPAPLPGTDATIVIALLATLDARAAAQLPAPRPLAVLAARPPPARALPLA